MGNNNSVQAQEKEMFKQIQARFYAFDQNIARQLGGIYLFCVMKKQSVRYWTVDLEKVVVYAGEPENDAEPDATFTLTEDTLVQLATGKIEARSAVQAGKCSVTGDIMRAMKLEPYIKLH